MVTQILSTIKGEAIMSIRLTMRRSRGLFGKVLVLFIGFSFMLASGASAGLFLKFDGIDGGSKDEKHKNWSDILDVKWGVSATSPPIGGGGSGVGTISFDDLSWTQVMDKSIIPLFSDLGKYIATAEVDFTNTGDKPFTYFKMEFNNVFLTDLEIKGDSKSLATIDGAFSYDFIKMTYTYTDDKGEKIPTSASYNIKTGTGSVGALSYLFGLGISGPTTLAPAPVPASLFLLGSGLVGLIGLRRKFKL
jgi:type VI secretion system secreted protein Hcp